MDLAIGTDILSQKKKFILKRNSSKIPLEYSIRILIIIIYHFFRTLSRLQST